MIYAVLCFDDDALYLCHTVADAFY